MAISLCRSLPAARKELNGLSPYIATNTSRIACLRPSHLVSLPAAVADLAITGLATAGLAAADLAATDLAAAGFRPTMFSFFAILNSCYYDQSSHRDCITYRPERVAGMIQRLSQFVCSLEPLGVIRRRVEKPLQKPECGCVSA